MTAWKVATVVVIGASAAAVVLFEAERSNRDSNFGQTLRWMFMLPFRLMHRRPPSESQIRQEAA